MRFTCTSAASVPSTASRSISGRLDHRSDRPERRRQVDALQRHRRPLHADLRASVWLDGEEITGLPPHALFHKGLLRTFQIAHEFSTPDRPREPDDGARRHSRRGALGHLVQPPQGRARKRSSARQGRRGDRVPRDRPRRATSSPATSPAARRSFWSSAAP